MSLVVTQEPKSKGGFDLKDYVEVKTRIKLFYERYPDGRLVTNDVRVSVDDDTPRVWAQALAYRTPDDPHPGVGWSWMVLPGSTSYTKGSELENTETSAWGRAIGSLGIGIEKSIASGDEIKSKSGENAATEREHTDDGSLIGNVAAGKPPVDLKLRQTKDGPVAGFKLTQGRSGLQVLASGPLADALHPFLAGLVGQRVAVWGTVEMVPWDKDGKAMPAYRRLNLERIKTDDWTLPADGFGEVGPTVEEPPDPHDDLDPRNADDDLSDLPGEWVGNGPGHTHPTTEGWTLQPMTCPQCARLAVPDLGR